MLGQDHFQLRSPAWTDPVERMLTTWQESVFLLLVIFLLFTPNIFASGALIFVSLVHPIQRSIAAIDACDSPAHELAATSASSQSEIGKRADAARAPKFGWLLLLAGQKEEMPAPTKGDVHGKLATELRSCQ